MGRIIYYWRFIGLLIATAVAWVASRATFRALDAPAQMLTINALEDNPVKGKEWPFVSIIVPARNEELNLPRLLPTLIAQNYPNYEVIIVDDESTDGTLDMVKRWANKHEQVKIVRGRPLPAREGWKGKPYAMHQGANEASGDWLLFTDADTMHTDLSVSSSVAHALSQQIDLLTLFPSPELITPMERLLMPVDFLGLLLLYPHHKVNDPASSLALGNGQFLLISSSVYRKIGGAERIKDQIIEDRELAKIVKSSGYRICLADGRHLLSVRMHKNIREICEGWSRIGPSFRNDPGQVLVVMLGVAANTVLPILLILWSKRSWQTATQIRYVSSYLFAAWITSLAGWNVAYCFLLRRKIDRLLNLPLVWAWTQPIAVAVFASILLYSLARLIIGRGITWKGRAYLS